MSVALALSSCANPANRRELYNTSQADSGPWHDYERRREAEAQTGISGGASPSAVSGTRGRPTAQPRTSNLPAGTSPAPAGTPAAQGTDTTSGAPPAPVNPPAPAAVATPAPDAAATPDAATPAPTPPAP